MAKKKKVPDVSIMSLGISRRWNIKEKIEKTFQGDDTRRRVFEVMLEERICGISALADIGKSTVEWNRNIARMLDKIPLLVKMSDPLVVIGQSGTGKESMARVLHRIAYNDDNKIFFPVNCSAIPTNMLESELFGFEKGAFTDAKERYIGKIESAKRGSFFLDELGKMDTNLQYKLLRVIEEPRIYRLGSNKEIKVDDVQFIIALQPKDSDPQTSTIAPDLLNRLNLYNAIKLPSLKERLRGDPDIIHDVLVKLQRKTSFTSDADKKKIQELEIKEREAKEAYEKSLRKTSIKIVRPEIKRDDGLIEAALGIPVEEEDINEGDIIIPDQSMWTKRSSKLWGTYIKYSAELLKLESSVTLSWEAQNALTTYDGYDEKNFRELEGILNHALVNAHIARRKKILLEDLPDEARNPSVQKVSSKGEGATDILADETQNVPLKDIINYADEMKKNIVRRKIGNVLNKGGNLKATLQSEGALRGKGDYIKFYKKVGRILGKGFIKNFH